MADKQGRKWQITINNPQDKGLDHDAIKLALDDLRSLDYFCMADEIGLCSPKSTRRNRNN